MSGVKYLMNRVSDYFWSHFQKGNLPEVYLDFSDIERIGELEVAFLESTHTLEEVKCEVWAYGTYKSSDYDGFNFRSFREVWDEVADDVVKFVLEFLEVGVMPRMVNVTSLTLILKRENLVYR